MNNPLENRLESALIAIRGATDSKGLRIHLFVGDEYTSAALRQALYDFTRTLDRNDMVFVNVDGSEDQDGEVAYAHNLQLLTNAYVAALEYERSC